MKSPLWILNSTFAVLFLISLLLVFFMRVQIPVRTALIPQVPSAARGSDSSKVNPVLIYENDLFGTIVKPVEPKQEEQPVKEIVIPEPPQLVSAASRSRAMPEFLPPLQLKLRGIVFNTNSLYSRAIVINIKSNAESLCKIGDKIEDATLVHIGQKKAVFVRPNGQQETLFITDDDAKKDPLYQGDRAWAAIVTPLNETTFRIDTVGFKKQITSVAQIIDQLDITPALVDGKNIGCRVGQFGQQSIGSHLGLKNGDIITSINGTKPTSTKNRVAIFKAIKAAEADQKITINITRGDAPLELVYFAQPVTNEDDEELKLVESAQEQARVLPSGIMTNRNQVALPPRPLLLSQGAESINIPSNPSNVSGATSGADRPAGNQTRELTPNMGQKSAEDAFTRRDKKSMLGYGSRSAFLQR